jgi:hypothetical protein
MNDFAPLTPEERSARLNAGADFGRGKPRDSRPFVRSSFNAPPPPSTTFKGRPPVRTDLYRERNGAPSLFVERFEWPDPQKRGGKAKMFRQHSLRGDEIAPEWVAEGFPDSELLPLFNLPEILANPDKPIVLVEGEKKVDPARVILRDEDIPTTAAMGAFSIHRTDWSPVAGRTFIVWRDHDAAGEHHLRAAAEALNKVGCRILVIDVAELVKIDGGARGVTHNPDGWDCADAVVEWTDLAALRAKAMELAKPYEDGTCTDYTTVPEGPEVQEKIRAELRERIEALNGLDENRAREIVVEAVKSGLSGLAVESLLGPLAKKLGVTLPSARKFWREIEREISAEDAVREEQKRDALSREERDAAAREEARKFDEERAETRKRLELSCREIAHDPNLLARLTKTARRAGVIGEDGSICSTYIAASSRFNRRKAICLLRRGAPAGGKNFVTDTVLLFIPEEDIVRVSSGSPLSLVYYGDGDENALKHKIVYVAAAAILAERNGVESVLTIMLRLLISEGRIDHQVVVTRPNSPAATVHIRRNGPVVVLITNKGASSSEVGSQEPYARSLGSADVSLRSALCGRC